jgi:hypothetical protein
MRVVSRILLAVLLATGFVSAATIVSAAAQTEHTDFSGAYKLKSVKGEDKPDRDDTWTVQITQSESEIKIVTTLNGHPSTEVFPLNGSESKCRNADGDDAKCTVSWNGKTLTLETIYTAHPTENSPDVEMHNRERLELSNDRKTLTIRTDQKARRYPYLQISEPATETYTRDPSR